MVWGVIRKAHPSRMLSCLRGLPRLILVPCLLVPVLVLIAPAWARAHVPGLEDASGGGPVRIGGPDVSRATYGYLAPGQDYDEYEFTVPERVSREVGIIVPAYPEHANFRPELLVAGGDTDEIAIRNDSAREIPREFEPFSLTYFWHVAEREVTFEPGVRYTMRVLPGKGDSSGRYVIVFAGPERFEGADITSTFRQLPAIWFGAYGRAPFRWNWFALVPIVLVIGMLAWLAFGVRAFVTRRRTR